MQAIGQPTLGSTAFRTPNPEFGATFTYRLADDIETRKSARRAEEKAAATAGDDVAFPGWETLRDERLESSPAVVLRVSTAAGEVIRFLPAETEAGLHRTTWDLRRPTPDPVSLEPDEFRAPWDRPPTGDLVPPGRYQVEIVRLDTGGAPDVLAGPETFEVRPIPAVTNSPGDDPDFRLEIAGLATRVAGAVAQIERLRERIRHLRATILLTPRAAELLGRTDAAGRALDDVAIRLLGDTDRSGLDEATVPSIRSLVERVVKMHRDTTAAPTRTQRDSIRRATLAFESFEVERDDVLDEIDAITAQLDAAGGPWTIR